VDLNCTDDDDARKRAEQMVDGHNVELWDTPAALRGLMQTRNSHFYDRPDAIRRLVELGQKARNKK
jgi:hypothetical protein